MKKHSEATQTLHAGCSKADPQTNEHTNRQGPLQYTEQLSMQCNNINTVLCNGMQTQNFGQCSFAPGKGDPGLASIIGVSSQGNTKQYILNCIFRLLCPAP